MLGGEGPVYTVRHLALCCHSVWQRSCVYSETFSSVLSFRVCCRLGGEGPVYTSRHLALCCHSVACLL